MQHLFLVRHSAVMVRPRIPVAEWALSGNGRSLCHTLAQTLAAHPTPPTRIITSLERKAGETGEILAADWNIPCQAKPGLHEHERQSTPFFTDQAAFATAVSQFFSHPNKLVLGEETAVAAFNRFDTAVRQQIAAYPNDTLALVTHGTVLSLFISRYNGFIEPFSFWQSLTMPAAFLMTLPNLCLKTSFLVQPYSS
ncbi:MAG: histidine phosphatase family protein [Chloroflexi bacterium]|nr:histidine phosphatase family protein [Chloroflexota bacterium]